MFEAESVTSVMVLWHNNPPIPKDKRLLKVHFAPSTTCHSLKIALTPGIDLCALPQDVGCLEHSSLNHHS